MLQKGYNLYASIKGRDAIACAAPAPAPSPSGETATAGADRAHAHPFRRAAAAHEDERLCLGRRTIHRGQLSLPDAAEARPASANGLPRRR